MPSKEPTECINEPKKDYFPCEVEDLVAAINRNLQLKSRPCLSGGVCSKQKRVTPYSVPLRTMCRKLDKENSLDTDCGCKFCRFKTKTPNSSSTDDPYEMLQDLLREGSLIKEAVKRLQLDRPKPKEANFYDVDDYDVVKSPHLGEVQTN